MNDFASSAADVGRFDPIRSACVFVWHSGVRFGSVLQFSADYLRSDLINHCIDRFGLVWFALLWVRMKFDRNRTPSCLSVLLNQHCASALLSRRHVPHGLGARFMPRDFSDFLRSCTCVCVSGFIANRFHVCISIVHPLEV